MKLSVNQDQLSGELETLASFSSVPSPAVTRIVFSEVDLQARAYLKSLCVAARLAIREDAVGNTFARWTGSEPALAAVASGSHIDAIPHSGRFDGTVGVLGALEAIRALQRSGYKPRRSIEMVLFTSEEPTRFGIGCLGSRLLAGALDASAGPQLKDRDGATLDQVRRAAGFDGRLEDVRLDAAHYHAFVELHIEQGPLLERDGIPLGIVTAIAAPASLRITIEGEGGHAGAVLMPGRRDAFLGACEIALAVELAASSTGAIDTVGTVGVCEIFPGAVNSIPSRVRIDLDVRDINQARRDGVLRRIEEVCREVGAKRNLAVVSEILNVDAPAAATGFVVEALEASCRELDVNFQHMVSRAYHDTLFMARITPVAMLFIPCRNGVSHMPSEFASAEDIARGAAVLGAALARLAS